MKKPFTALTKNDVEFLRRQPCSVPQGSTGVTYTFSAQEVADAIAHLKTLYTGKVEESFAMKILLLNEIY